MSLIDGINQKDIEKLRSWAIKNAQEDIFSSGSDSDKDSYYSTRNGEDTYISVYDFNTMSELEGMFQDFFGEQMDGEIRRIAAACAIRYRPDLTREWTNKEGIKENLPEHIYVF